MQVLLDTHLFIWWLKDDPRLSKKGRSIITDASTVYISSISIWESAIKIKLGKLKAPIHELIDSIEHEGFIEMPLLARHTSIISELPMIHRDPFDRALIAQAISEPLRLLTSDKILKKYTELVEII